MYAPFHCNVRHCLLPTTCPPFPPYLFRLCTHAVPIFPVGAITVPIVVPTTFELVDQRVLVGGAAAPSQACVVTILAQLSASVCELGSTYWCSSSSGSAPTMSVTGGCRGQFLCNGKEVECESESGDTQTW